MQNFQRNSELQSSAGSKAKGVISGVGKGIVGVFTKPIGGAAELVSQTGYGEFTALTLDPRRPAPQSSTFLHPSDRRVNEGLLVKA